MAEIINERDVILQTAAARTVPVAAPDAIIIPGYTGIELRKDISMWVISFGANSVTPDRAEITAILKGIPQNSPVTWTCNVPMTDTPDPLVKLIEAKNYPPRTPAPPPHTLITVSVDYGGQTFTDTMEILVFSG